MNLLFLCGSLEPGRDGVGDYTRRLAAECTALGHHCALVALHDPHVTCVTCELDPVEVRRFPLSLPWADRIALIVGLGRAHPFDWVSWQLVAYGFSPRGILPPELRELAGRLQASHRHIMMHELWLGLEANATTWERLNGALQRRAALRFLHRLNPDVVQTSNPSYQAALTRRGFPAKILELFGNVPITASEPAPEPLIVPWLCGRSSTRAAALVAITFGTLHPQWQPATTIDWLVQTAAAHRKRPTLLVAGRAGRNVTAITAAFRQRGVHVSLVGEQDATTVSLLLKNSDLGIAAHPWALVGKSGAVAAMLEHGLPVVVPRDDWHLAGDSPSTAPSGDPLLARLAELDAPRTRSWLAMRRPPESLLPRVAVEFLQQLAQPVAVA